MNTLTQAPTFISICALLEAFIDPLGQISRLAVSNADERKPIAPCRHVNGVLVQRRLQHVFDRQIHVTSHLPQQQLGGDIQIQRDGHDCASSQDRSTTLIEARALRIECRLGIP
jgi:hypothetical protein